QHYFIIYLVIIQVAFALHISCGAEFTAQGAAYLGGDAGGLTFIGGDEDAFDEVVVDRAKAAFDGAVGGILCGVDPEGGEGKGVFHLLTEVLAQVSHGLKARSMPLPYPFIDLAGPELLLSK